MLDTLEFENKKVMFFDTWATSPQVETSLDLCEQVRDIGGQSFYINIANDLSFKEWIHGSEKIQQAIVKRRIQLISRLCKEIDIPFFTDIKVPQSEIQIAASYLESIEKFKTWEDGAYDWGMGIISSAVSYLNNAFFKPADQKKLLQKISNSSFWALASFEAYYNEIKPDMVFIRNARTALNRPILRFCQINGIPFRVHERAGLEGKFKVGINTTYIHDRKFYTDAVNLHWNNSTIPEDEKIEIATSFYDKRLKGDTHAFSFISDMETGKLPEGFDTSKHNLVFYSGSLTEYAAIDRENEADTIFDGQFEAVQWLIDLVKDNPEMKLYIRLHPNTQKMYPHEYMMWRSVLSIVPKNVEVIEGRSSIDTYTLAQYCSSVLVYMTTVGIEAAFRKKPVIVLGNAFYKDLGSNYLPENLEELKSLVLNKELEPKGLLGCYKYAFFNMTRGRSLKYFKPTSMHTGLYRGKNLVVKSSDVSSLIKAKAHLKRIKKRIGL